MTFEDLSGLTTRKAQIQARYGTHRERRNEQQRARLLAPDFGGVRLDPILQRVHDPRIEPGYVDPRHCLVFWARPPGRIRRLVSQIQQLLQTVAPDLWLMPLTCLHMTALEITHSRSAEEIGQLVCDHLAGVVPYITDYPLQHRARLLKPLLTYDDAAVALSFLPAAGEGKQASAGVDGYTYHHLRRDLFDLCSELGVTVDSRYVVPSAHVTIARFVSAKHFSSGNGVLGIEKMKRWVTKLDEINHWLKENYWQIADDEASSEHEGQWRVGEEKGLDCRLGTLWYGGGATLHLGRGY
ncbi:MAG: transport between ER and Golgi ATPase protein [Phylliscum demangeonii]|nr:MAG: transport between ER and Golgi ATPase protein [Phylliscum demangeonii]